MDSIATGSSDTFKAKLVEYYIKYDLKWWLDTDAKYADIAAAASRCDNKKKQKDFVKTKFKEWGLKDNGEPKDKKKEEGRIKARAAAFVSAAKEPASVTEGILKSVKSDGEDATFATLFERYQVADGRIPDPDLQAGGQQGDGVPLEIEGMEFFFEAFYQTYNPDGRGKIEGILKKINDGDKTFENYVESLLGAYGEKGAVPEEWDNDVFSYGVLVYLFRNFFAKYDKSRMGEAEELARGLMESEAIEQDVSDRWTQLCGEYDADPGEWDVEFPPALRDGPLFNDDDDAGSEHNTNTDHDAPAETSSAQQGESPDSDDPARLASLEDFFRTFCEADVHRAAELAPGTEPLLDVLATLYSEYNVSEDDSWAFELPIRFGQDALKEDYRQRLSEFFAQNASTMKRRPSNVPQVVDSNVARILDNALPDKEFWPTFYAECGVDFGVPWPPSRLIGAPPARCPGDVAEQPQPFSSKTSGVGGGGGGGGGGISRHNSMVSQRSTGSAAAMRSRKNSLRSNVSDVLRLGGGGGGGGPGLSRQNSLRSVRSTASAAPAAPRKSSMSASGGGMAVPGVISFVALDISRVCDSESIRKVCSALRWDLAKNFGHPLEDTVIDASRGGLLTAEFHFKAQGENAHHVHASANMTLQKRNLQFPSLSQEYKNVAGVTPNTEVSYDRTDIRAPLSLRDHQESMKQAGQHARAELREKLEFFHVRHAPTADLANVDLLVAKSKLDEVDLFKALYSRYGLGQYDGAYSGDEWRSRLQKNSRSQMAGGSGGADLHARLYAYFTGLPADSPTSWGAHFRKHPEQIDEKVEEAILTLQTTGMHDAALFRKLDETYRNTQHPSGVALLDEERVRRRLTEFYMAYNPAELYKVELAMQAGLSEDILFVRLHEKYGLPPPLPANRLQEQANQQQLFSTQQLHAPHSAVRSLTVDAVATPHSAVAVGAVDTRERMLAERELALDRNTEAQARSLQLREDSLVEWERQNLKREEALRQREHALARLEERELIVTGREQAVSDREAGHHHSHHRGRGAQSRSISPAPESGVASKLKEQEEKLRVLSERLDRQVRQVTEREEAVAVREAGMLETHNPAAGIIAEQMKALEERERVLAAKEAALMQSTLAANPALQRENALDTASTHLTLRQQDFYHQEGLLAERALQVQDKESVLLRREAEIEEKNARLMFLSGEQPHLTVQQRQVQEHGREVEMRDQVVSGRERAVTQREQQVWIRSPFPLISSMAKKNCSDCDQIDLCNIQQIANYHNADHGA